MESILSLRDVSRDFVTRGRAIHAMADVSLEGTPVRGVNTAIGYVTQADNLYPWRTLRENVEFRLELRGVPRAERRDRAEASRELS